MKIAKTNDRRRWVQVATQVEGFEGDSYGIVSDSRTIAKVIVEKKGKNLRMIELLGIITTLPIKMPGSEFRILRSWRCICTYVGCGIHLRKCQKSE